MQRALALLVPVGAGRRAGPVEEAAAVPRAEPAPAEPAARASSGCSIGQGPGGEGVLLALGRHALDRHALYEVAVQTPEHDVELLERLFRDRRPRSPRTLREDFCGTALVSIAWVGSDDDREALAVDLDREVVRRAGRHARALLDEGERERLRIVRGDVRAPSTSTFDLVLAPNFSWGCFHDRAELGEYFAGALSALEREGLLVIEIFGGRAMRGRLVHRHRHDGFTYVWEHRSYDVASEVVDARIHFELDDGRRIDDAFQYSYRVWRPDEVRAILTERGASKVELVVEDARGALTPRRAVPTSETWNGYLIAAPPRGKGW